MTELATFYAAFNSSVNANWGAGALLTFPANEAAIYAGKLDLSNLVHKFLVFDAVANADSLLTGTIEFRVTPSYTGASTAAQIFFAVSKEDGSLANAIVCEHTDGTVYYQIFNAAAESVTRIAFPWSPVAHTEYIFRCTYGPHGLQLFIDGALVASNSTPPSRTGAVAYGVIGEYPHLPGVANANFAIRNMSVYSMVTTPPSAVLSNIRYPSVCRVYGYVVDSEKNAISGVKILAQSPSTFLNAGVVQAQGVVSVLTDANGYFEMPLCETTSIGKRLAWSAVYPGARGKFDFGLAMVPDTAACNFSYLTFTK